MIFDPAIVSKFQDCGVMLLDSATDVLPAALRYLGLDPDSKKPEDLAKAADVVKAVRPYVRKFHSSEYINALAGGNICLAFGYSGDIFQARDRGAKAASKVDLEYAIPKEGLAALDRRDRHPEGRTGRAFRAAGRLGLRQDHPAAHAGRLRDADLGRIFIDGRT
jgi:putrescine transport system substrate-binding protein